MIYFLFYRKIKCDLNFFFDYFFFSQCLYKGVIPKNIFIVFILKSNNFFWWFYCMNNRIEIAKSFADAINSDKIVKIILFGSVARGEDTVDSDIDILIISDYGDDLDALITDEVFKVVLDKQEIISPHILSEREFDETKDFNFLSHVLSEGVVIG